jgi:uncharacterized protein with ParB-like and HNH nuclease domain
MITLEDIKKSSSIYSLPRDIHVNKGVLLDYRLFQSITGEDSDGKLDHKYDFDVYLPTYDINLQRPYVWEHCQQEAFIKTILLDRELEPVIVVQEISSYDANKRSTTMLVIDGKQRLTTIIKFANNEFSININGNDVYWRDFDDEAKWFFRSRVNYMMGTVYYSYPDCRVTDDMKIKLFNFYNFSGTPQTEEHKNMLQNLMKD